MEYGILADVSEHGQEGWDKDTSRYILEALQSKVVDWFSWPITSEMPAKETGHLLASFKWH
jgi:hypothetical protein